MGSYFDPLDPDLIVMTGNDGGASWVSDVLSLTDRSRRHHDLMDAIMTDFERKLKEIAADYQKRLEGSSKEVRSELAKSRAVTQELNQLVAENVAKDKEASEELKRKVAEVLSKIEEISILLKDERLAAQSAKKERDRLVTEKISEKVLADLEISNLKKQLVTIQKERDDLVAAVVKMGDEKQEMRVKLEALEADKEEARSEKFIRLLQKKDKLYQDLAKINKSLLFNNAEIHSLKTHGDIEDGDEDDEMVSVRDKVPQQPVEFHQFFNESAKDHFYTTDLTELGEGKVEAAEYVYKGSVGRVYKSFVEGTVPIFRYWNEICKNHFCSTKWNFFEFGKGDYIYEGINGYILSSPVEGTKPLVRYFNTQANDHLLTTDWGERDRCINGYIRDKIVGYVL